MNESNKAKLWQGLGFDVALDGFVATVQLPHKTPIHHPVRGKMKPRADLAKRSTALEVIRELHRCGELTEDLKVRKKEMIKYDEDYDDSDHVNENELGRSSCLKFYKVIQPPILTENTSGRLYLHIIELRLVKPLTNPRYNLHYPQDDTHSLGLLTSAPLPLIGPLDIHGPSGLVHAFIRVKWKPVSLSREELNLLRTFHKYIFTDCLQLTSLHEYERSSLPIIVPVDNEGRSGLSLGDIDLEMCENISNHLLNKSRSSEYHLRYNLAHLQRRFPYIRCFQDLVLHPLVKEATGPTHYFIEEVSSELTASTVMDGLGMSMSDYYRVHHGASVQRSHQKLLRISSASKELHMLQPGGEPVADGKTRTYRSYKGDISL